MFVSVLNALALANDPEIFAGDPTSGALGERIAENVPPATTDAPLLLAQGGADGLVVRTAQDAYVDAACAAGESIDYRVYDGLGHVGLVEADSPLAAELVEWTRDRFASAPVAAGCSRSER